MKNIEIITGITKKLLGKDLNTFSVGSYIANFSNLNFSSEIHEIDGRAVAKRGKLPGIKNNPKLGQIM